MLKIATEAELFDLFVTHKWVALAGRPELYIAPAVIIKTLATAQNCCVRESLGLNPAIARFPEIIEALANDIDPRVRYCVAANPALSSESKPKAFLTGRTVRTR